MIRSGNSLLLLLSILVLAGSINSQPGGFFESDNGDDVDDESAPEPFLMELNRKTSCSAAEGLLSKFAILLENHAKDLPPALIEMLQMCLVKELQKANLEELVNGPYGGLWAELNRTLPNATAQFALRQQPPLINQTIVLRLVGLDITQILLQETSEAALINANLGLSWIDNRLDWSALADPWNSIAEESVVFEKDLVKLDQFFWLPKPRLPTAPSATTESTASYTHVMVGNGERPSDTGVFALLNFRALGADCQNILESQKEVYACSADLRLQLDQAGSDCTKLKFSEEVSRDGDIFLKAFLNIPFDDVKVKPSSWKLEGKLEIKPALDEQSCALLALRFRLSRAAGFSDNGLGRLPVAIATILALVSTFVAVRMAHSLALKLLAFALALFGHVVNAAFALMSHGHHNDYATVTFLLVWIFATALIDQIASRLAYGLRRKVRHAPPSQWLVFGSDVILHYAGFLPTSMIFARGVGGKDQKDAGIGESFGEVVGGCGGANLAWLKTVAAIYGVAAAFYSGVYGVILVLLFH